MDVTCSLEDLELYDSRVGVGEATFFTISRTIVWAMGIIAGDYKREFSFRVYHLTSPAKEISKFGASG